MIIFEKVLILGKQAFNDHILTVFLTKKLYKADFGLINWLKFTF